MAEETQQENSFSVNESLHAAENFIDKNKKQLLYVVAGIAGVFVLYFAYKMLIIEPQEKEAQAQMFTAQHYFEADSLKKAIDGDGNNLGFKQLADDYSSTRSGNLAKYYLGLACLKAGRFQEAVDALEDYSANDEVTGYLAKGALGDAYLELGNVDEAISAYSDASSDKKDKFITPIFLKRIAMIYESQSKYEQALEIYTRIKNEYAQSVEASDMDKYIARAEVLSGK